MQKGIETKCENCGRKLKVKGIFWLTDKEFKKCKDKDNLVETTEQNTLQIECRHCHKIKILLLNPRPVIIVKPYRGYCEHLFYRGYPLFNG